MYAFKVVILGTTHLFRIILAKVHVFHADLGEKIIGYKDV